MNWKEFFKLTTAKLLILIFLFVLSMLFGFFKMSGCFIDENGLKICRECGVEGIFNPLLRPVSFILANIIQGLLVNKDIQLCGATFAIIFYWPLDIMYQYFISSFAILLYNKFKK